MLCVSSAIAPAHMIRAILHWVCLSVFSLSLCLSVNVNLVCDFSKYNVHICCAYSLNKALSDDINSDHLITRLCCGHICGHLIEVLP